VIVHASNAAAPSGEPRFAIASDRASLLDVWSLGHEVASGNADWPALAFKLSELLDGQRTVLFMVDARSEAVKLLASSTPNLMNVPERFLQVARRHGRRLKARVPGFRLTRGNHAIFPAVDDLVTWQESLESDSAFIAGYLLGPAQTTYFCLACGADDATGGVGRECRKFAEVSARLLARAVESASRAEATSAQLHAMSQILDRSSVGIIQLDLNGAVIELNAAALRIAEMSDAMTISTAGVHATTEADEMRLQQAIAEAIAHRGGNYIKRFSIRQRSGLPTGVVLTSMDRAQLASADQTCCVLFVMDLESLHKPEPSAIVDLLGLTPAQARVAAALAAGTPLAEVATKLGVTVNTVRTLLSRAMSKTGTKSQVSLVRLVYTTVVPLPSKE
jgi:DNA-binding CsgD family transcriptional regulator